MSIHMRPFRVTIISNSFVIVTCTVLVLISSIVCGCGMLHARPLPNTNAVETVAFGSTNIVPDAVIAAGVTAACAALGIPVTVGAAGLGIGSLVLIGLGVWRWAASRNRNA